MPDVDEGVDPPGESLWGRAVLSEQCRSGAEDFDLGFELPDALVRIRQLHLFCCREPGPFAPLDLILAHPLVERSGADGEFDSGGGDQFSGTDECYGSESELRRITVVAWTEAFQRGLIFTPGHERARERDLGAPGRRLRPWTYTGDGRATRRARGWATWGG